MTDLRTRVARKIMERALAQEPGVWRVPADDFTDEDLEKFGFLEFADAAIAEAFKWQPIETAPHEVNVLLTWRDWSLPQLWRMEAGMASWGWRNEVASTMSRHGEATYWAPLPPPPVEGGE